MPAPPRSSLVGLPEPGRGEAGGFTGEMGWGRPDGPIDALELVLAPLPLPGAGEGLGLVDGGRRVDIGGKAEGERGESRRRGSCRTESDARAAKKRRRRVGG